MKVLKLFLLVCLVLMVIACEDDEKADIPSSYSLDCSKNDEQSLPLVTGIRFFDDNGIALGQAGNPNINNDQDFLIYPNPNNGRATIERFTANDYHLFVIPASKDLTCSMIDYSSINFTYAEDSLIASTEWSVPFEGQRLTINLTLLEDGYYRMIFYKEGQPLIIENIYYEKDRPLNEMYDFLINEF